MEGGSLSRQRGTPRGLPPIPFYYGSSHTCRDQTPAASCQRAQSEIMDAILFLLALVWAKGVSPCQPKRPGVVEQGRFLNPSLCSCFVLFGPKGPKGLTPFAEFAVEDQRLDGASQTTDEAIAISENQRGNNHSRHSCPWLVFFVFSSLSFASLVPSGSVPPLVPRLRMAAVNKGGGGGGAAVRTVARTTSTSQTTTTSYISIGTTAVRYGTVRIRVRVGNPSQQSPWITVVHFSVTQYRTVLSLPDLLTAI